MKIKHTKVATLAATLITFGSLAGGANAALILNVKEVGSDVVVSTTGGSLNLSALSFSGTEFESGASVATINTNFTRFSTFNFSTPFTSLDLYSGFSLSQSLADTGEYTATVGSGPSYVFQNNVIGFPAGYSSGSALAASSATIENSSLSDMGLNNGDSIVWSWGAGATSDSVTVNIGAVPEPSSALLFGLGATVFVARRRRSR